MIFRFSLVTALVLGATVLAIQWRGAPEPQKVTPALAERVLEAVAREDYEAFIAQGDARVRMMRAEDFQLLAQRHASRLRKGHQLRPLDERWRGNVHVSRWTVTFSDGTPDAIVTVGAKDGRVATFAMY